RHTLGRRAARRRCGRCHDRAGRVARRRVLERRVPADGGVGVWTLSIASHLLAFTTALVFGRNCLDHSNRVVDAREIGRPLAYATLHRGRKELWVSNLEPNPLLEPGFAVKRIRNVRIPM